MGNISISKAGTCAGVLFRKGVKMERERKKP